MKQIILSIAVSACFIPGMLAQNEDRRELMRERMEAQRVAFITQRLDLTPEESQKFWPLYNEYRAKQRGLRENTLRRSTVRNLSDAEAVEAIEQHLMAEEHMLKLKREYFGKLKTVVSPQKVAVLASSETDFSRAVLERVRDQRTTQPGRPGPRGPRK